jgi:hypothetical protein
MSLLFYRGLRQPAPRQGIRSLLFSRFAPLPRGASPRYSAVSRRVISWTGARAWMFRFWHRILIITITIIIIIITITRLREANLVIAPPQQPDGALCLCYSVPGTSFWRANGQHEWTAREWRKARFSGWRAVCFAVHFGIETGSIG